MLEYDNDKLCVSLGSKILSKTGYMFKRDKLKPVEKSTTLSSNLPFNKKKNRYHKHSNLPRHCLQ